MKPVIAAILLLTSLTTFANEGIEECEKDKENTIKSCYKGLNRCTAHNPDSAVCEEIFFNCTTRAHEDYNYCIEKL